MYHTYKLYYTILFETFLLFSQKRKYKTTLFLYVPSNKGFLEFSTAKSLTLTLTFISED